MEKISTYKSWKTEKIMSKLGFATGILGVGLGIFFGVCAYFLNEDNKINEELLQAQRQTISELEEISKTDQLRLGLLEIRASDQKQEIEGQNNLLNMYEVLSEDSELSVKLLQEALSAYQSEMEEAVERESHLTYIVKLQGEYIKIQEKVIGELSNPDIPRNFKDKEKLVRDDGNDKKRFSLSGYYGPN